MTAARDTSAEIDAVAADWAARHDAAPLTPVEQARLDAWLAADARRLGAYAKARAVFAHIRQAKGLGPGFDPDAFASAAAAAAPSPRTMRQAGPSRRRLFAYGGAAAAGLVLTGGWLLRGQGQAYSTKLGEVRAIPLADGSTVTLNTRSRLVVRFTDTERRMELVSGEALFDVAKDAARPFVVTAGDTTATAIGTSFTVSKLDDTTTSVLVREGVVAVDRLRVGNAPAARAARLTANMRARATATDAVLAVTDIEPTQTARALSWREGMIAFEDTPLSQAAAEFARYSDTPILITDSTVAAETVTGVFSARNPTGFAETVASVLDLKVEAQAGALRLHR